VYDHKLKYGKTALKMSQISANTVSTGKHKTLDVTVKLETIKGCAEINDSKSVTRRCHNLKAQLAKTDQYFKNILTATTFVQGSDMTVFR
jgi:hypothetical protein